MMAKKSSQIKEVLNIPYISNGKTNVISEKFKTLEITDDQKKIISTNIKNELGEEHPFDYCLIEDLTKKFGLVNAIVEKITDFTIGPGVYIESDDESIVDLLEKWIKETNFRYYLRPWAKEALVKGSGYLEVAGLGKKNMINTIKCVNANNMFVKKDEYGTIEGYTQYLGNNYIGIDQSKKIDLSVDEIIKLDFNKIGTCSYGYGIVYSALETVDYFLSSNKSMHTIMRRKANSQVHWKLGNAEKDDYPKQEDIDAFAGKLQFMNDTTEMVTGPNAEAKVIDFGNIGEKFAEVLANDYKLLSYCFQVPEMLLGSDRGWSGSSEVQLDAFERNCKSKQEEIAFVLRNNLFNKILEANGKKDIEYEIVWGQPSEDDKIKELETYRELLKIPGLNSGLYKAIEKKLACVIDIDYDEIYEEPMKDPNTGVQLLPGQQPSEPVEPNGDKKEEPEEEQEEPMEENKHYVVNSYKINDFIEKLKTNLKGNYKNDLEHSLLTHKQEKLDVKDYTIKEYLNKDYKQFKEQILKAIEKDEFSNIKADNKVEMKAGYLSETKINRFREVLKDGIMNDKSLKAMKKDIIEKVKLPALYEYNKKGLIKDDSGRRILLLSQDERAEMILRTELTRIGSEGFIEEMSDRGETLVEWVTADDERVCPICEDLDNKIFEVASIMDNMPPAHVNCRCTLEKVSIQEKQKILKRILEDTKLAPQEKDAKICKLFKVDEKDLAKLIEETLNGKTKLSK